MTATVRQIKERVLRLLNDEPVVGDYEQTQGSTYGPDLLIDAIRAALQALTARQWKMNYFDISEAVTEFPTDDYDALPDDLLEITSVFDNKLNKFIPRMNMVPGNAPVDFQYANSWIDIPDTTLRFGVTLGDTGARVYYIAAWGLASDEEEDMEPPDFTHLAIVFYAASYCLLQQSAGIATIRQYNTRVDSGPPSDNATNEMANYFLRRFEIEMARIPMKVREQTQ